MHEDDGPAHAPAEATLRPSRGRFAAPPSKLPWSLAVRPRFVIPAFALASVLYALFLYPWDQLNTYTQEQLIAIGANLDRVYLAYDSGGYLDTANSSLGAILREAVFVDGIRFGLFTNVTLLLLGWAALAIAPEHPYVVIALVNHALLAWAALHLRAIARRYGVDFGWLLALMLLNPLVLFCVYTLNKEAIGLFLVAGLVRYRLDRNWVGFAVLLLLSLYTRNIFFLFGLLLLLLPWFYELRVGERLVRVRAGYALVAASLIVPLGLFLTGNQPFGPRFPQLDLVATYFDQQTRPFLTFALKAEKIPFGYLLSWPIVTGINVASPAFNVRYWRGHFDELDEIALALQLSSVLFVGLLVLAYRARPWFGLFAIEPLRLIFFLTLVSSAYPISQHRYLLPLYPLLVLGYLIAVRRGDVVIDRACDATPRVGDVPRSAAPE